MLKVLRKVADRQMDRIFIACKNKVQFILMITCLTDVLNLSKRFWSKILGERCMQETAVARHFQQQDSSVDLRIQLSAALKSCSLATLQ